MHPVVSPLAMTVFFEHASGSHGEAPHQFKADQNSVTISGLLCGATGGITHPGVAALSVKPMPADRQKLPQPARLLRKIQSVSRLERRPALEDASGCKGKAAHQFTPVTELEPVAHLHIGRSADTPLPNLRNYLERGKL